MLTCNLFQHTCFSCLKSTFFILSYQLHCCWLDDPHRFPGPTHSTGGRGVDVMTMTMAGGVGGGPGTWNIYILYNYQPFKTAVRTLTQVIIFSTHDFSVPWHPGSPNPNNSWLQRHRMIHGSPGFLTKSYKWASQM